jgi:hypothetical protein
MEDVSLKTQPIYLSTKSSRYALNRRLGGPLSRSRHFGDDINILVLPRTRTQFLGRPVRSLITTAIYAILGPSLASAVDPDFYDEIAV